MKRPCFTVLLLLLGATAGIARAQTPRTLAVAQMRGDWGVNGVAWSPDGRQLAVGVAHLTNIDKIYSLQLWDVAQSKMKRSWTAPQGRARGNPIAHFVFSPDGATIAIDLNQIGVREGIHLWRWHENKQLKPLDADSGPFAFVSNQQLLSQTENDLQFQVWNVSNAKPRHQSRLTWPRDRLPTMPQLSAHGPSFPDLVLSHNARRGAVLLWRLAYEKAGNGFDGLPFYRVLPRQAAETWIFEPLTGRTIRFLVAAPDEIFLPKAFSRDGRVLATVTRWRSPAQVRLYEIDTGREMATFNVPLDALTRGSAIDLSPQGATFAVATAQHTIELHDTNTGALKCTLQGHTKSIISLAFSPDGTAIASGSLDGTVKLWRVK